MDNHNRRSGDFIVIELLALVRDLDIRIEKDHKKMVTLSERISVIENKIDLIVSQLKDITDPWYIKLIKKMVR